MQQTQMMQMLQVQQPILEENQVDEVSEGSFMIMIKPAARQVSTAPVQRLCSV
jgi:spore coat protein CotF